MTRQKRSEQEQDLTAHRKCRYDWSYRTRLPAARLRRSCCAMLACTDMSIESASFLEEMIAVLRFGDSKS